MDAQVIDDLLQLSAAGTQVEWLRKHAPQIDLTLIQHLQEEARQRERQNPHHALAVAELVQQAAHLWQDESTMAVALHIEADARRLLFEHSKALQLYQQAAKIYQSLGSELQAAYVVVGQIATMKYLGHYQEALDLSHWVSDVFRVANDQTALGKIIMNRGNIFARQKRFPEALASYNEARTIFIENQNEHHLALVQVNEANIHMELDNFRQAEKIYQQVRVYFQQQQLNSMVAQIDHNIGHLLMSQGKYQKALVTFDTARALFLAQGNSVEVASIDLMRSDIYLALNLWEEAYLLAEEACPVFAEAGMSWEMARLYLNQAAALARLHPQEAPTAVLAQARQLFTEEANESWLAMTDLYEATFAWRRGDWETAVSQAQQAHTTFHNNGFHSHAVQCTLILGEIALMQGKCAEAAALFNEGMAYLKQVDLPAISFACHFGLGRTHQAQNQLAEAQNYYRQAITDIERLQASIGAEDYKIAFLSDKLEVYQALVLLCLDLETAVAQKEAFETIERAKSRTLLDNLAREKSRKSASPTEASLVADINRLKQELNWYYNRLNHPQIDPDSPETLADLTHAVSRRERALSQRLKKWRSPDLESVPRNPIWTITLPRIQAILPQDTLLLEFYTAKDQLLVFGVTAQAIWHHRYNIALEQINEFLSEFRFQINKFSYGEEYRQRHQLTLRRSIDDSLHKLYQTLIAPIEPHLATKELLIVPHGLLHYVPFHALFNGRSYLIDNYTVSYAPSATVLYHTLTAEKQTQTQPPLILGLADETIPFAAEEAQAISALFPQADIRLDEKATLPAEPFWESLPAFMHLSTHATFRADNPLFSAVKLHDRWLSVNDIYGMDAPVPLVTLSACETGQNQVLVGDELLGLCRGFFAAGVHSLVVSLWLVDDHSTTQLMTKFYQGLQAGLTVNKALRQAQLAMKATANQAEIGTFDHPYYWAPFILTGSMQTQIHTDHFL